MCDVFEGGDKSKSLRLSPPPLGTAVLGSVPATADGLLGVDVLPPLAYPEELVVIWKSKLNNTLVQL